MSLILIALVMFLALVAIVSVAGWVMAQTGRLYSRATSHPNTVPDSTAPMIEPLSVSLARAIRAMKCRQAQLDALQPHTTLDKELIKFRAPYVAMVAEYEELYEHTKTLEESVLRQGMSLEEWEAASELGQKIAHKRVMMQDEIRRTLQLIDMLEGMEDLLG